MAANQKLEETVAVCQRWFLEQAAIDATEEFYKKLLDQTPRLAGMGEFLFHVLSGLESNAAKGRRYLHDCERRHQEFLTAPAEAILDRLAFASRLLCQFAQYAGGMTPDDASVLQSQIETALRGDPQDPPSPR